MAFFDIFKPATPINPVAAPATPAPATPDPAAAAPVTEPVKAPLDSFKTLWETDPNAKQVDPSVFGTVDPRTILDAAKGANFAGLVSQEYFTAISQGGEAAIKAYQESLNQVAQSVFAQSTLATTKIVEQAIAANNAKHEAALPDMVKRHSASSSLLAENPALSSPAAAPIIKAVEAQIAIKHPSATAAQLTEMAKAYLAEFADTVKPVVQVKAEPTAADMDWSKYLGQG